MVSRMACFTFAGMRAASDCGVGVSEVCCARVSAPAAKKRPAATSMAKRFAIMAWRMLLRDLWLLLRHGLLLLHRLLIRLRAVGVRLRAAGHAADGLYLFERIENEFPLLVRGAAFVDFHGRPVGFSGHADDESADDRFTRSIGAGLFIHAESAGGIRWHLQRLREK